MIAYIEHSSVCIFTDDYETYYMCNHPIANEYIRTKNLNIRTNNMDKLLFYQLVSEATKRKKFKNWKNFSDWFDLSYNIDLTEELLMELM